MNTNATNTKKLVMVPVSIPTLKKDVMTNAIHAVTKVDSSVKYNQTFILEVSMKILRIIHRTIFATTSTPTMMVKNSKNCAEKMYANKSEPVYINAGKVITSPTSKKRIWKNISMNTFIPSCLAIFVFTSLPLSSHSTSPANHKEQPNCHQCCSWIVHRTVTYIKSVE